MTKILLHSLAQGRHSELRRVALLYKPGASLPLYKRLYVIAPLLYASADSSNHHAEWFGIGRGIQFLVFYYPRRNIGWRVTSPLPRPCC